MKQATTIGLDIAKHVFQVHGADGAGHVLFRKRITRVKLLGFLAAQTRCVVAMEACAGAHYWAREIAKLGHHVRLIAPAYVKPFIKRQKNDAADAEAICEAAQRPSMASTQWYPKIMRKDYTIGLNITETAVDDPDPAFYEKYVCGAMRNYTGYCSPEVDKMVDEQSAISDVEKRKQLAWAIEKKLADDDARPILFYTRVANCHYPKLKGLVTQVNSIYNGQRFEDLWLDN